MTKYTLAQTGGTDLQTTFRFQMVVEPYSILGLTERLTAYITETDLPRATGEPIIWSLPGGMKNHQAGKRTIQPINMTFVIPSTSSSSWYRVFEKWGASTYNLNTGTNIGKSQYCTDGISIEIMGEDDAIKYIFRMLKAQLTDVNYGTLNSETNDLLKVSGTLVYDNYQVTDGNGVLLSGSSNA